MFLSLPSHSGSAILLGGGGFGGESGIIPYIVDLDKGLWKVLDDIISTIDKVDNSLIYPL